MEIRNLPIACSLDRQTLNRRQADLRAGVLAEAASVERLENGYRWQFHHASDLFERLGAVIDAERRCCRFLHFAIHADQDLGLVTLDISGPAGTADFLEGWVKESR